MVRSTKLDKHSISNLRSTITVGKSIHWARTDRFMSLLTDICDQAWIYLNNDKNIYKIDNLFYLKNKKIKIDPNNDLDLVCIFIFSKINIKPKKLKNNDKPTDLLTNILKYIYNTGDLSLEKYEILNKGDEQGNFLNSTFTKADLKKMGWDKANPRKKASSDTAMSKKDSLQALAKLAR